MSPFQRIIMDGQVLEGAAIVRWADVLVAQHNNAQWAKDVRDTLHELTTATGDLHAHTSGTTGEPKRMLFAANDLIASARLTEQAFALKTGDRTLLCLPCGFIAGKMMLVRAFVTGLDLHVSAPDGEALAQLPPNDHYRFSAMVPLQLQRLLTLDRAGVERRFATILLGGGPVSAPLKSSVQGLATRIVHGYGSTETLTHVALRDLGSPDHDDIFTAIGDVTFEEGSGSRLILHTPHLSTKTHHTNDIVDLLDARRFRWIGRADHVILSGGKKIIPEQLEARTAHLIPYPYFFTSGPDDALGECIVLVVEKEGLSDEERNTLNEALSAVLTKHERPKRIMALRSFKRTSSGKVLRALGG
jgi:o-succinylbenzoate---CoA ligase